MAPAPRFLRVSRPFLRNQASFGPEDGINRRGFYRAYDRTLLVGVPRAAVAIYLYYYTRGGGGLTGRIGRKRRNTSAAARRTPSPGAPLDGGFICASADTLLGCISRSVLSIL